MLLIPQTLGKLALHGQSLKIPGSTRKATTRSKSPIFENCEEFLESVEEWAVP
jgi:hypothetical protein